MLDITYAYSCTSTMHDRMVLKVAQNLNRYVMQALQAELHLVNSFVHRFEAINPDIL